MYIYKRLIHVQDTDATGVLYFANQLQIGLEAFEHFMSEKGHSVGGMVCKGNFLLPIVHTEGDFLSPLTIGDKVLLKMEFTRIGTTSFTHESKFYKEGELVGTSAIVHVAFCPQKREKIPIPKELIEIITEVEYGSVR